MPTLTLCYGLPGSGKSTRLKHFHAQGYVIFDDYMKCSLFNLKSFAHSRHAGSIVSALRQSKPCAVADVILSRKESRNEIVAYLTELIPELVFEWHCFDCSSPEAIELCRDNVLYRLETHENNEDQSFRIIDDLKEHFSIEDKALVYNVSPGRRSVVLIEAGF